MKTLISLLSVTFFCLSSYAQTTFELSFANKEDTLKKSAETDLIYKLNIKSYIKDPKKVDSFKVYITADPKLSSLPATDYILDFKPTMLTEIGSDYTFYMTIKRDKEIDHIRLLYLQIKVTDKNGNELSDDKNSGAEKTMKLMVKPSEASLNDFNYLGYIGTNFDLVDGVKPKNLFFATSAFLPPTDGKRYGFNVMIYGNRAFTNTITNGRVRYASRIEGKGNNTAMTYYDEGLQTIDRTTDNLGALFSPLIYLGDKNKQSEKMFQVYYSPQIEFIWRRTALITSYSDIVKVDSTLMQNRPITGTVILTPETQTTPYNVYDFNFGFAGVTLKHETRSISVRINMTFGVNFSYTSASRGSVTSILTQQFDRESKWFMGSKLWITEPGSGLTFGAEIYNNVFDKYQPYYNVTLSKAINFANIGKIFSPITTR